MSPKGIERIARELELENIAGVRTEIASNRQITVEGCLGINEYEDTLLRLNLPHGQMLILGSGFEIRSMESSRITISGKIQSLEFIGGSV